MDIEPSKWKVAFFSGIQIKRRACLNSSQPKEKNVVPEVRAARGLVGVVSAQVACQNSFARDYEKGYLYKKK